MSSNQDANNDLLDLTFDPESSVSSSAGPSLRPPKLSEAQLLAVLELGFNGKYLPSSVTGGESSPASTASSQANNNQVGSMINNHHQLNQPNSQGQGQQGGQAQSGGQYQYQQQHNQYPLFVDNYSFNLTEQQQQGLLPPLRRPDINQLPPDVLAVLLKSTRFEEILIPNQRRLQEVTPSSVRTTGTTATEQETGNSSTTRAPPPPSSTTAQSKIVNSVQQQEAGVKSKLSPFAKEFVPGGPVTMNNNQQQHDNSEAAEIAYAMSQVQVQGHGQGNNDSFQGLIEELDGSDCILSTVTDMISQVSQDPASLNRCAKVTVDVLKKHLNDDDTLGIVVTLLVEQMISNQNFCYSGAKILEMLRENGIGVGENSIKKLVLTRMHEEFTHCLTSLDDPEVRNRSLGVLRLLSELYMNFAVLPDNSKLHIFALAVLELMEKLLQKDNSLDTVKCICQLMKLIGYEVENSKNEKVREYFGLVLKELSFLKMKMTSEGKLHPTCDALIDMVFKLHSNKWNRGQEETTSTSTAYSSHAQSMPSNKHPVYYELPDSDDDSFGDDVGIMIDDEPDEVQAAYEEFLKMNENK